MDHGIKEFINKTNQRIKTAEREKSRTKYVM